MVLIRKLINFVSPTERLVPTYLARKWRTFENLAGALKTDLDNLRKGATDLEATAQKIVKLASMDTNFYYTDSIAHHNPETTFRDRIRDLTAHVYSGISIDREKLEKALLGYKTQVLPKKEWTVFGDATEIKITTEWLIIPGYFSPKRDTFENLAEVDEVFVDNMIEHNYDIDRTARKIVEHAQRVYARSLLENLPNNLNIIEFQNAITDLATRVYSETWVDRKKLASTLMNHTAPILEIHQTAIRILQRPPELTIPDVILNKTEELFKTKPKYLLSNPFIKKDGKNRSLDKQAVMFFLTSFNTEKKDTPENKLKAKAVYHILLGIEISPLIGKQDTDLPLSQTVPVSPVPSTNKVTFTLSADAAPLLSENRKWIKGERDRIKNQ